MERAKHDLREARRADILHEQVKQWHTAIELDHYLDEMRKVVDAMTDEQQRQAAEEWLSWATTYRATIDPLQQRLALPPDEEPTPEALRPYLRGWNPYGPDGHP